MASVRSGSRKVDHRRRWHNSKKLYCFFSMGNPSFCHSLKPPSRAAALLKSLVFRLTTAPADVCSFGQEQ